MDVCMGILAGDTGKTSPLYLEKRPKQKGKSNFLLQSHQDTSAFTVWSKKPQTTFVSNFCDRITVHPYSRLALIITS